MKVFEGVSLKTKYLKCFGDEGGGFDEIKPLNLIIGRNNSGKSTLLDMLQFAIEEKPSFEDEFHHGDKAPVIICEDALTEVDIQRIFKPGVSGGWIPGNDHWQYGMKYIGALIGWNPCDKTNNRFLHIQYSSNVSDKIEDLRKGSQYLVELAREKKTHFLGKYSRGWWQNEN